MCLKIHEGGLAPFFNLLERKKKKTVFPFDVCDKNGSTLLHYLCSCKKASRNQLEQVVDAVLSENVGLLDHKNNANETPLHLAILKSNTKLVKLLVDRGSDIRITESTQNMTSVHVALTTKDLQMIEDVTGGGGFLCEALNTRDTKNRTALQLLMDLRMNDFNLISKFLSSGALPCELLVCKHEEERMKFGDKLFIPEEFLTLNTKALFEEWGPESSYAMLYRCIQVDDHSSIKNLIQQYSLDPNATKFWGKLTPLYIACRDGKYNAAKQL